MRNVNNETMPSTNAVDLHKIHKNMTLHYDDSIL